MVQSYRKSVKMDDHYDTIIIGSGISGLTTAVLLAREGQKVLILERHYVAGGRTHTFKRAGYEWDVGVHYLSGDLQNPDMPVRQLIDFICDGKIEWADLGEVYDVMKIGKKTFQFVKGVDGFKDNLIESFPEEEEAIEKFVQLVLDVGEAGMKFHMSKAIVPSGPLPPDDFKTPEFFLEYAAKSTYEVLESLTSNKELIQVLSIQYGGYGTSPKKGSFGMHAFMANAYLNGASFPVGGASVIADTIIPFLNSFGGKVFVNADVKEICVEDNKAKGVIMQDGRFISSNNVVSSTGIEITIKNLLPSNIVDQYQLKDVLTNLEPSLSHGCLFIGLKGSPEELELPKYNMWVLQEGRDHDDCLNEFLEDINKPFPFVHISFPSAKDTNWSNQYPDKSTIDIITSLPYELFEPWKGEKWNERGEEYNALKESISQRLLEIMYEKLPQLKGKVEYYELSTPITTEHFVTGDKGGMCGTLHSPERFMNKFLQPKTPVDNFYLSGHDIMTCGVGAAMCAGYLTASAMTETNQMEKAIITAMTKKAQESAAVVS